MSRHKRTDLVFAAEDPWRNLVRLERFTWESHIVPGHPEVEDTETGVLRRIIEAPDTIHRSAASPDCGVFQVSGLVMLVVYESEEFNLSQGDQFTRGRVATVYPQPIGRAKLTGILYSKRERGKRGRP